MYAALRQPCLSPSFVPIEEMHSSKADTFLKFVRRPDYAASLPPLPNTAPGRRDRVDQVPPIDRGELPAFQTIYRETPNLLGTDGQCQRPTKTLKDVWQKALFDQAAEIPNIDIKDINKVDESGKKKILRYVPDRFERARVQRPVMTLAEVDVKDLSAEEKVMHPKKTSSGSRCGGKRAAGRAGSKESTDGPHQTCQHMPKEFPTRRVRL